MRSTILMLGYHEQDVEGFSALMVKAKYNIEIIAYKNADNLSSILKMVNIDLILFNYEPRKFEPFLFFSTVIESTQVCAFVLFAKKISSDIQRKAFLLGASDCLQTSDIKPAEIRDAIIHVIHQKKRQQALQTERSELMLLRAVIDNTPSLIMVCDPQTSFLITFNQALIQFLGLSKEQVKSRSYFHISEQFETAAHWFDFIENVRDKGQLSFEVNLINAQGKSIPFEFECVLADILESQYLLMHGMEISRLKGVQAELEDLATKDPLTLLRNRRGIAEEYNRLMKTAIRSKTCLAVAVFDLDNFKQINDQFGHDIGDNILKSFAQVLRSVAQRPLDLIVRAGGEEFIVIMLNSSPDTIQALFKSIVELTPLSTSPKTTVSAGAICLTGDVVINYEQVFKQADQNLYKAKLNGKNQLVFEIA
ncbi:sensor domain-containing diguanylate cyclase [Catenovulum sp. 2E275]|uniref:GGDEF domain-containing protein n=1 Tax=Catenovulum sp. 2E275 TaxID=2980497 RepID=UPI0021D1895F|nr:sensor domain-containing diguanylate cyclase [Catenovulum sp. 2E275]MCU4674369.1 sensor domain-containing diguanylate cyclase [Catenovulum sp. 2E275]